MSEFKPPSGWERKPLADLARIVSGGTPARDNPEFWENGTIPWATPTDITNGNSRILTKTNDYITEAGLRGCSAKLLPAESILMTSRATLGESKIAGTEICTNQGFKSLVPNDHVDNWFLYYLMRLNKGRYEMFGIGSTFLEVNKKDTEAFELDLPPLPEQRKIARILSTVDEQIERTEALIAKYQAMKQGLMHDLLTRGVDGQGRLRPPREQAPELYKWSALGWVPRGWGVRSLQDAATQITSGSRGWAQYYSETGAVFLRIGNLTRKHINLSLDAIQRVRPPNNSEGSRTAVDTGDILVSVTADLGIIGVIPSEFEEAYVNQHIALIRLDSTLINPRWVGHYLAGHECQIRIQRLNDSGAKAGLNLPAVASMLITSPPRDEQYQMVNILDKIDTVIQREERQVAKYVIIKTGLMQDLLTGRVRVEVDTIDSTVAT